MSRPRSETTLAIVRRANEIWEETYQPLGIVPTVRQYFYALAVEELVDKSQRGYSVVQRALADARERGEFPWEGIADHLRELERPQTWGDLSRYFAAVRRSYRLDRWQDQPERLELWIEKDTVRGTVADLAEEYQVPLLTARGFLSCSAKNEACQRIAGDPRPLTALYVGDHDPSGINMLEGAVAWIGERIPDGAPFSVERIAITDEDRSAGGLLSFLPVNMRDTRSRAYVQRFGPTVVEVEALAPEELQRRVKETIEAHIDRGAWNESQADEERDQREIADALGGGPA